ncbi:MAG: ATP-binding protein [Bacteroidales bacterium]
MDTSQIAYQDVLGSLPATSVILFDAKLDILQVFDQDRILDKLFPGMDAIESWAETLESTHQVDLIKFCKKSLEGTMQGVEFDHPTGRVSMQTKGFPSSDGKAYGSLVIQVRQAIEKKEAEESNEIKSRLLARISHEIRTPLNAIIGFLEQLQKTNLNDKQKNFTNIIEKSSVYLLDLVNEVLSFSRLESGQLKLDEVDFSIEKLFREIYNTLNVRAYDKCINLRLTLDERLTMICRGDAFRLKQVVINLVSNGIKFTEFGYVELGVCLLEEKDNLVWIRITVSDTGIGIPKQKQKEIFDEYKQASSGIARKHGGSGLGLTISKRLTEVMKGKISVESTEGKGSVFSVDLPLRRSQREFLSMDAVHINSEELSGTRALLVDDDAMNRALGKIIMEGFNMEVSLVNDGKEAIKEFKKGLFDVVLLDIHMPEMSGLEVARFIREQAKDKNVKIIAVTADMLQAEEVLLSRYKVDDVMIKPYREINLYNKICEVLEVESKLVLKESIEIIEAEPTKSPSYNLSELKMVTRGNIEFFNEMIDTFIENASEGIEQIKIAFNENNWFEMHETAHRLIPSFKHLEIYMLVSDLVEIKRVRVNIHNKPRIESLIRELETNIREIIRKLEKEKNPT